MGSRREDVESRWAAKVAIPPDVLTGCWLWTGGLDSCGYGQLSVRGRLVLAHRFAWTIFHGDPARAHVRHSCHTRRCVNPAHLSLGTHQDNMRDMVKAGRQSNAKVTEQQVLAIRADPRPLPAIARDYGLTPGAVWRIKRRLNWAHVKESIHG